ncbi:hypothetical protein TNCV_3779461 [Trichonephila clavipes]|nr:hypothetical protein TNCV_3779461 [Trichonephila clavipes]
MILTAVTLGLGSNPRNGMIVFKWIVLLRHGGTLNSHPAASLLMWLEEREERWEAPDPFQDVLPPTRGTEPKYAVTCLVLKAMANDRHPTIPLPR